MYFFGNFSTASNRADWQEVVVLIDEDTGDPIDISLCRITLSLAKLPSGGWRSDYNDATYGRNPSGYALRGSTDDGTITLPDVGCFQWIFTAQQMAALSFGEYQIGVRIAQDGRVEQLVVGTVNVFEGVDWQ